MGCMEMSAGVMMSVLADGCFRLSVSCVLGYAYLRFLIWAFWENVDE